MPTITTKAPPEKGSIMTSEGWKPLSAANLIGEVNGTKYNVVVDDTDTTNPQFGIEEIA